MSIGKLWPKYLMGMLLLAGCSAPIVEYPDLDLLQNADGGWRVMQADSSAAGSLTLYHDYWYMHYLHWRPLNQKRREISVEYVADKLLSFWSTSVPFTIVGDGGRLEIAGHEAYYADATNADNSIRTRFIIWNCPQTGRQFISDCNINTRKGTPEEFLEIQYAITESIMCHGAETIPAHNELTRAYDFPELQLSLRVPKNWQTAQFNLQGWYPHGSQKAQGSLWSLPTDSERSIDLFWSAEKHPLTKKTLQRMLADCTGRIYKLGNLHYALDSIRVDSVFAQGAALVALGNFSLLLHEPNFPQSSLKPKNYKTRAYLYNSGRTYLLLASCLVLDTVWGMPVNLEPSEATLRRFAENEVVPAVPSLQKQLTR